MTSERWRRSEQIYEEALQRLPTERPTFLESACAGDQTLRRDVERLIAANDRAGVARTHALSSRSPRSMWKTTSSKPMPRSFRSFAFFASSQAKYFTRVG